MIEPIVKPSKESDDPMRSAYKLTAQPARFCTQYKAHDPAIPEALYTVRNTLPDLSGFPLPLPSRKADYTCFARVGNVFWYGATTGLTRYEPDAARKDQIIQFFAADRDLQDNCVLALLPDETGLWVRTETGATHIEMRLVSAEEKALMLLHESQKIVDRWGMYSQKHLTVARDLSSKLPYGHSDNDGGFTSGFAMGELFHYAVCKREKGADHPDTIEAKKAAVRACEASLLLMHIHGRGNGFVARTYMCAEEPMPEDGVYFRLQGDKAVCLDTPATRERGSFLKMYGSDLVKEGANAGCDMRWAGMEIDASAPIPQRLMHLITDHGHVREGIFYKADTSSDEITHHFLMMLVAHETIGKDDPELDALLIDAAKATLGHIIDHGYELTDATGEATTWAKWSERYFATELGYVDACLNAAEVLAYHKILMHISGETGRWQESYDYLISRGYADLATKHFDRMQQCAIVDGVHPFEDIMYGDHMLAVLSFWALCTLETDPALLEKYKNGFRSWRTSLAREYDPGYDLPYALATGDEIDMDRLAEWLYRMNVSRLAAGVSTMKRHDTPVHVLPGGTKEITWLLPNDERFISKYDRNPFDYKDVDSGGLMCVESCYIYTFAYWMGRYYGFFA